QISSSSLTSLDSSFFLETVPDSYGNTNCQTSLSAFSLLPSSPPLQQSFLPIPPFPIQQIRHTSPPNATDDTLRALTREPATCSFIHFHGTTTGTGSARCWTCAYCK